MPRRSVSINQQYGDRFGPRNFGDVLGNTFGSLSETAIPYMMWAREQGNREVQADFERKTMLDRMKMEQETHDAQIEEINYRKTLRPREEASYDMDRLLQTNQQTLQEEQMRQNLFQRYMGLTGSKSTGSVDLNDYIMDPNVSIDQLRDLGDRRAAVYGRQKSEDVPNYVQLMQDKYDKQIGDWTKAEADWMKTEGGRFAPVLDSSGYAMKFTEGEHKGQMMKQERTYPVAKPTKEGVWDPMQSFLTGKYGGRFSDSTGSAFLGYDISKPPANEAIPDAVYGEATQLYGEQGLEDLWQALIAKYGASDVIWQATNDPESFLLLLKHAGQLTGERRKRGGSRKPGPQIGPGY